LRRARLGARDLERLDDLEQLDEAGPWQGRGRAVDRVARPLAARRLAHLDRVARQGLRVEGRVGLLESLRGAPAVELLGPALRDALERLREVLLHEQVSLGE